MVISDITLKNVKQKTTVQGMVEKINQTSGPTLFTITDGTGTLTIKAFDGAGIRAYPDVKEDDFISAKIEVREFNGKIEGEVSSLKKLDHVERKELEEAIDAQKRKRAKVEEVDFLVKSPVLDKLKERFVRAAEEIKLAILAGRPIIVRHHNDADGYSSGYTLERAILPLIEEQHGGGKSAWEYFTRAPCAAPFYEIEDSIKDTMRALNDQAKFSAKLPLVIIVDNGSSPEDLLAIKQAKVHGMDFIVVDHHFFGEDVISREVLVHINPFLVDEDGMKFSAGMLCTELARFISPVRGIEHIPALAGMADRVDNPEVMQQYISIAKEHEYSEEFLRKTAAVLDFVSAKLRFMEAREYIAVIFGDDRHRQEQIINLFADHIKKLEDRAVAIGTKAVVREKHDGRTLQLLDIEKAYPFGAYPKAGKSTGLVHDVGVDELDGGVVTIGLLNDVLIIRASNDSGFSVHAFIDRLHAQVPEAFADGGGHKFAGSIKFVPMQREKVLACLRKTLDE